MSTLKRTYEVQAHIHLFFGRLHHIVGGISREDALKLARKLSLLNATVKYLVVREYDRVVIASYITLDL